MLLTQNLTSTCFTEFLFIN